MASKPKRLPSAFQPTVVEWKALELPLPDRGVSYISHQMASSLDVQGGRGWRPRPPSPRRKKSPGWELSPAQSAVWVCDADEEFLQIVEKCLRAWGFAELQTFQDGERVLSLLEEGRAPHVLIVGAEAGSLRGTELAQSFAHKVPDGEVVLAALPADLAFALEAKSTHIHELILKPVLRTEDLRTALSNALLRVHQKLYLRCLISDFDRTYRSLDIEARFTAELAECSELSKVWEVSCRALSEIFHDGGALYFQYVPAQRALMGVERFPQSLFAGTQPKLMVPSGVGSDMASVRAWLADLGEKSEFTAMLSQAAQMSPELMTGFEAIPWKTALVETRGIPRGVIAVLTPRWNEKTDPVRLQRLARQISQAVEISYLHARLAEVTTEDPMTGVANEKFLKRRLSEELSKATRLKHPLSLMVFSQKGAQEKKRLSEKSFREFVKEIQESFRATDIVARRGRGEVVVVLPHTPFVDALKKAESVRADLRARAGVNPSWVASAGVAEYPGHAATTEELLFAAEEASAAAAQTEPFSIHIATARSGYVPPFLPESPRSTRLTVRQNAGAVSAPATPRKPPTVVK